MGKTAPWSAAADADAFLRVIVNEANTVMLIKRELGNAPAFFVKKELLAIRGHGQDDAISAG